MTSEASAKGSNKNKYLLDTERLKKLEKIMRECEIEPSHHFIRPKESTTEVKNPYHDAKVIYESYVSFDHADLESVLPDWLYDNKEYGHVKMYRRKQFLEAMALRGQEKLEAMCDLIIMLYENGIELKTIS